MATLQLPLHVCRKIAIHSACSTKRHLFGHTRVQLELDLFAQSARSTPGSLMREVREMPKLGVQAWPISNVFDYKILLLLLSIQSFLGLLRLFFWWVTPCNPGEPFWIAKSLMNVTNCKYQDQALLKRVCEDGKLTLYNSPSLLGKAFIGIIWMGFSLPFVPITRWA